MSYILYLRHLPQPSRLLIVGLEKTNMCRLYSKIEGDVFSLWHKYKQLLLHLVD